MRSIELQFTINTLEDFHIGTGLDCVSLYDDGQYKDRDGNPAIRTETLKGLIKQSCSEVVKILNSEYKPAFDQLFEFKNLGSLDVYVEYVKGSANIPFVIHRFTKIDQESGIAETGSLRDIEFGSKGCRFEAEIRFLLINDEHEETVRELLIYGIRNLKWLGGYRRRGFGAVKCEPKQSIPENETAKQINLSGRAFRLRLELQDDVCLAGAGQTGNIIQTMDYISGTTVMGMLRNILLKINKPDNCFFDDGNMRVTNFYPVKSGSNGLVIPVPLSLRKKKSIEKYRNFYLGKREKGACKREIPHWALQQKNAKAEENQLKNIVSQDTLIERNNQETSKDKSFASGYIICANYPDFADAIYYNPNRLLIMRNSIDAETQTTKDNALFSQEMIEKKTQFTGEITFVTEEAGKAFIETCQDWLVGKYCLHAGRGGKPIKIIDIQPVNENRSETISLRQESPRNIAITLISDAILFNEELMPETELKPDHLGLENELKLIKSITTGRIHQSFCGVAGLRRFSDRVISKGSCFLYEMQNGAAQEAVIEKLRILAEKGIGLKTDEGFGSFLVNMPLHWTSVPREQSREYITSAKTPQYLVDKLNKTEELLQRAREESGIIKETSENFVNRIISYMEVRYSKETLKIEIEHGKSTRNSQKWKEFEVLFNKLADDDDFYEIIKLIYLKKKSKGGQRK
jgi:CRISPR/Cas system CSM-associated protein Csm4 (group 5 of RAMP superfamily)